jgi:hypothetical protein
MWGEGSTLVSKDLISNFVYVSGPLEFCGEGSMLELRLSFKACLYISGAEFMWGEGLH